MSITGPQNEYDAQIMAEQRAEIANLRADLAQARKAGELDMMRLELITCGNAQMAGCRVYRPHNGGGYVPHADGAQYIPRWAVRWNNGHAGRGDTMREAIDKAMQSDVIKPWWDEQQRIDAAIQPSGKTGDAT
jgi:hypothetical protein